jgi:hypothetical protein
VKRPEDFSGIFIHQGRVDMRKGINGLAEVVEEAGMGELRAPTFLSSPVGLSIRSRFSTGIRRALRCG